MKRIFVFMAALVFALCACQPMGDDITLALVNADPDALLYTYERQTVKLKMDCNRSWKASCSEEWIALEETRGSEGEAQVFIFVLSSNPDYTYRTGTIVITAGDRDLVLTVTQEPEIKYYLKENFDDSDLIVEDDLPKGWRSIDADGDGFGWRRYRDPETEETYAYSCSFQEDFQRVLTPDNWMVTPKISLPGKGFCISWDVRGSDAGYLGDNYQVYVANLVTLSDGDVRLLPLELLFEEKTISATKLTHHSFSLDSYAGMTVCIAFRHYDSTKLARVLITNVEVTNSR